MKKSSVIISKIRVKKRLSCRALKRHGFSRRADKFCWFLCYRCSKFCKQLQKAFRELLPYGLELDFIVKGAGKQLPKTVEEVLKLKDPTDQILNQKSIIMYHGTSSRRWQIIKKQGLRPGKTDDTYVDLVSGYSEFNVYLLN